MKTAKVFIASTFKDIQAEWDYLNEHIYPGSRWLIDLAIRS